MREAGTMRRYIYAYSIALCLDLCISFPFIRTSISADDPGGGWTVVTSFLLCDKTPFHFPDQKSSHRASDGYMK